MPQARSLSPELARSVSALARALVTAARSWTLYPADHPAVRTAVERLQDSLATASGGQVISLGVTPDTLIIQGETAPAEGPVAEAATWLHQRDILQLSFAPEVPVGVLHALLSLLAEDVSAIRARGGPAEAWAALGLGGIGVEQIDFSSVLEDRDVEHPARRKDDLWRSIVMAVTSRHKVLDEALQRRLLEISADVGAIGELAQDVIAPNFAADGSPMLTSQAAAVVAAYRHLVGIVDVMEPARRAEVMHNLAAATASLDSRVVLQMLGGADDRGSGGPTVGSAEIKRGIADAFDDAKVAQLLATTLAIDGQASGRLAGVFDTIAPDESRKRRVLTMTRSLLSETSFGKSSQFATLWTSMEELLLTYNERPFVSAEYRQGLDQVGARAETMRGDVPEDLLPLIDTLAQDNVRRLSATLLIDLLTLETDPARAPEIARDVAALAEDLLLAGDYDSSLTVVRALAREAANAQSVTSAGSRLALESLSTTTALVETTELLEEMPGEDAERVAGICEAIGPASVEALRLRLDVEEDSPACTRAAAIIEKFGRAAVSRLAPLTSSGHWYARAHTAELMGRIGAAEAVPLLQPLIRGGDARVIRAAVRALASIQDPAAARSVHTVLRAATGEQRRAVVEALVEERDPRVVPVLACILDESEPFGSDHPIVLETLGAVGTVGRDDAIPHVARLMRRKTWFARKKARSVKQASLDVLRRIGSPAATKAIADAAADGDRLLRKLAREVPAGAARG